MTEDAAPSLTELINRQLGEPPKTPLVRGTRTLRGPAGPTYADELGPDPHEGAAGKPDVAG